MKLGKPLQIAALLGISEARSLAIFEYIEVFYSRTRRHSTLGYKLPMQHLDDWRWLNKMKNLVA